MLLVWRSVTGAAALVLSLGAAEAATVSVSGSGFFGTGTATTAESKAGETFTFSFITPNPIPGNPDTALTNPYFSLGGVSPTATSPTISSVNFGNDANGGLFDLVFSDSNTLSFYGATIDNGGFLQSGFYIATVGLDGGRPTANGSVSVSVNVSPVPLPDAAPMFGAALLGLGMFGYACKQSAKLRAQA